MTKQKDSSSKYKPTLKQQKDVIAFAIENKCIIHPRGMDYYVEGFNEFKHCVCDKNRPQCPCPEAPQEIKEKGHCFCQLFWLSLDAYLIAKKLVCQNGEHEWTTGNYCKNCFIEKGV